MCSCLHAFLACLWPYGCLYAIALCAFAFVCANVIVFAYSLPFLKNPRDILCTYLFETLFMYILFLFLLLISTYFFCVCPRSELFWADCVDGSAVSNPEGNSFVSRVRGLTGVLFIDVGETGLEHRREPKYHLRFASFWGLTDARRMVVHEENVHDAVDESFAINTIGKKVLQWRQNVTWRRGVVWHCSGVTSLTVDWTV